MNTTEPDTTAPYHPTPRDLVNLDLPYGVKISPGGGKAAVVLRTTNWKDNAYDNLCYAGETAGGRLRPLHRAGSTQQAEWLDDDTLAVLRGGPGEAKPQVYLYEGLVGEGWQITDHKTGVEWFAPFAGGILFKAQDPERAEMKTRADRFGKLVHFEQEPSASALYYTGLDELRRYQAQLKAGSEEDAKKLLQPVVEVSKLLAEPLSIQEVVPSPAGDALYLNCRLRDDLVYERQTQVFCLQLDAPAALAEYLKRKQAQAGKEKAAPQGSSQPEKGPAEDFSYLGRLARLNLPGQARVGAVSPDGRSLVIGYRGRDEKMYTQEELWLMAAEDARQAPDAEHALAAMRNISAGLDREVMALHWVESGIYGSYADGCFVRIARFGPDRAITRLDFGEWFPMSDFHISKAGRIGMAALSERHFPEAVFAAPNAAGSAGEIESWAAQTLTRCGQALAATEQGAAWELGSVEVIRWQSKDGVEIEGVLHKPPDFDPSRRYPLALVVHGGPTWYSTAALVDPGDLRYYPALQLANRGVLVLKPNYRGSLGRGQAFMELNVNNLGVGDLWDLESAIDHLAGLGWVDPERVGCMGWSQGGYISAFAGLHSGRFKAVSVGAGISDWYTYHISNDIPDFTVDYLSGSPFRDRQRYIQTAPVSNLANARTPMLIQHGQQDRRVPFSNAMELYRGLKEMGVPVELFAFPDMGHPITRPRENHAVLHQNLAWFAHYLLGDGLNFEY